MSDKIDVSKEFALEASGLIYRKWSEAFDNLKACKAEKPDYKRDPDWDLMHAIRLENGEKELARLKKLVDEAAPLFSDLIGYKPSEPKQGLFGPLKKMEG